MSMKSKALIHYLLGIFISLWITTSHSMWLSESPSQLLKTSTLVVEGTLIKRFEINDKNRSIALGLLKITSIYKGQTNQPLITIELPNSSNPIVSTDIHYKIGTSGLWLLNLNKNGLLSANHPQRFIPMDKADSFLKLLNTSTKQSNQN